MHDRVYNCVSCVQLCMVWLITQGTLVWIEYFQYTIVAIVYTIVYCQYTIVCTIVYRVTHYTRHTRVEWVIALTTQTLYDCSKMVWLNTQHTLVALNSIHIVWHIIYKAHSL